MATTYTAGQHQHIATRKKKYNHNQALTLPLLTRGYPPNSIAITQDTSTNNNQQPTTNNKTTTRTMFVARRWRPGACGGEWRRSHQTADPGPAAPNSSAPSCSLQTAPPPRGGGVGKRGVGDQLVDDRRVLTNHRVWHQIPFPFCSQQAQGRNRGTTCLHRGIVVIVCELRV